MNQSNNDNELAKFSNRKTVQNNDSSLFNKGLNLSRTILNKTTEFQAFFESGIKNYIKLDIESAVNDFSHSLLINPNNTDCLIFRGFSYYYISEFTKGENDLSKAVYLGYSTSKVLKAYAEGCLFAIKKEYQSMMACYHKIIAYEATPNSNYFCFELMFKGYTYYLLGDKYMALKLINETLDIQPDFIGAIILKGFLLHENQDFYNSLSCFERAFTLSPNHTNSALTFTARASVYNAVGDVQSALADFSNAINLYHSYSKSFIYNLGINNATNAFLERGKILLEFGDTENALADFGAAIDLDPSFVAAYIQKAMIFFQRGANDLAIKECNKALHFDQNLSTAYILMGQIYNEIGDIINAINHWKKGFLLDAEICQSQKNYQREIEYYNAIIDFDPYDYIIYNKRSTARLNIGDYQGAMEDLQKAQKISQTP